MSYSSDGNKHNEYFFDNNEMAYFNSNYTWVNLNLDYQTGLGLKPTEGYDSRTEHKNDLNNNISEAVVNGDVFYILWRKPIECLEVGIEVPKCGDTVSMVKYAEYGAEAPDNRPIVSVDSDHAFLYYIPEPYDFLHTYWTTGFKISDLWEWDNPYEGTFIEGNEYLAAAYLESDRGVLQALYMDIQHIHNLYKCILPVQACIY